VAFGYQANEKLNIASIGVSNMGDGNLRNVSDENIVALCDVDERQAGGARGRHPKAKYYKDFRRMFAEMGKGIDAVVVTLPTTPTPWRRWLR